MLSLLNDIIAGEKDVAPASPAPSTVSEIDRILALPRRPPPPIEEQTRMAAEMTKRLRWDNPKCACALLRPEVAARGQNPCITELRPIQGWYLTEAANNIGALGHIRIGGGKTGPDILLAMVVKDCELAILLIPSNLKTQLLNDYRIWRQHFQVPNLRGGPGGPYVTGRPKLEIFPYSHLSQPKNSAWLKARAKETPNLIVIADECHAVKDVGSVRTFRFLNLFEDFPDTRGFFHSGTLFSRSILDATHLAALSLRDGSPAPIDRAIAEDWALALDPIVGGAASAAPSLKKLCQPGETVRKAFRRRFIETPGVVSTEDAGIETKLEFRVRTPPPVPFAVEEALERARNGVRPDDEELEDAYEIAACCKQLAAGFYLYWAYPRGEPEELILEWLAKRKAWGKELRTRLTRRSEFMDSPALLIEAAERYHAGELGDAPTWHSTTWPAWAAIADKVRPVTKVKWLDDWLMRDAVAWGKECERTGAGGIIWCLNDEPRQKIAQLGGFVEYGGGGREAVEIQREKGDRTIVASIKAHGTGRNLQYGFHKNLFAQLPSDGYDQFIGRTYRDGQPEDTVTVDFYQHTPEYEASLETAEEYARFGRDMAGSALLLYGQWVD